MSKPTEAIKALNTIRNGSYDDQHSTMFEEVYHHEFEVIKQALTENSELKEGLIELKEYYEDKSWIRFERLLKGLIKNE